MSIFLRQNIGIHLLHVQAYFIAVVAKYIGNALAYQPRSCRSSPVRIRRSGTEASGTKLFLDLAAEPPSSTSQRELRQPFRRHF